MFNRLGEGRNPLAVCVLDKSYKNPVKNLITWSPSHLITSQKRG